MFLEVDTMADDRRIFETSQAGEFPQSTSMPCACSNLRAIGEIFPISTPNVGSRKVVSMIALNCASLPFNTDSLRGLQSEGRELLPC